MTEKTIGRLLIDGEWRQTGETFEVRSPYSDEVVGEVAWAGAAEAREAVDAAQRVLDEGPLPAHRRAAILDRVAEALTARREEIAAIVCAEAGKPIAAARAEVERAASTYSFSAAAARTLAGEVIPMDASAAGEGKVAFTMPLPVGVVGAITPFNFPVNLVAHKIAPALAAGCPVVLKPAKSTPLSALMLAELEEQAGLPAGWLSVVVGPAGEIGDVLVEDPRVKLITFTGSGPVGADLQRRASGKRVKLELGNSTPAIVLADADIEAAAKKLAPNAFAFAGQSCISLQRVYVEEPAYEEFLKHLVAAAAALKAGDPADADTFVGPVIDSGNRERIVGWIGEAREAGAEVVLGGETAADGVLPPTIIARAGADLKVSRQEVFGPVCTVNPIASLEEGVALANGTEFGLQAGIFTRDVSAAIKAAGSLEFGGVTINEAPTFRTDQMPYGGVKLSGNTREGPAYAVREMTEDRLVVIGL